jgi:oligoendopeptidase F
MTTLESPESAADVDLTAAAVAWNIDTILPDGASPADLFDEADALADSLLGLRGRVGELDASELATAMHTLADLQDLMSRAGYHAMLAFSTATDDPSRGAAMAAAQERSTAIGTKLIFLDLEWAAADDAHAAAVMSDPQLDFCRHHLENLRLTRPHLLSEPRRRSSRRSPRPGSRPGSGCSTS